MNPAFQVFNVRNFLFPHDSLSDTPRLCDMLAVLDLRPFGFTVVGAFSATSMFGCYSRKHHCKYLNFSHHPQRPSDRINVHGVSYRSLHSEDRAGHILRAFRPRPSNNKHNTDMSDNNSSPNAAFSITIVQINPDPGLLLQSVTHQTENIGGKICFAPNSPEGLSNTFILVFNLIHI